MKKPIHDMQVLQVTRDRVLIFGGHTDGGGGPNKEIHMIDLSLECFKAKFGSNSLHLPDESSGGKTYFPPVFDPLTGKVSLIFGYCDQPPLLEEIDISDFAQSQLFLQPKTTLKQNFIEQVPFTMNENPMIYANEHQQPSSLENKRTVIASARRRQ